jgi:hypothetical protein
MFFSSYDGLGFPLELYTIPVKVNDILAAIDRELAHLEQKRNLLEGLTLVAGPERNGQWRYSHQAALSLYELSDMLPTNLHMAVPTTCAAKAISLELSCSIIATFSRAKYMQDLAIITLGGCRQSSPDRGRHGRADVDTPSAAARG